MLRFLKYCLFLLLVTDLSAKEYAVVASFTTPPLTQNQVRALFLKKSEYLGDTKIVPLNLALGNPIRSSFEKKVLHMNRSHLKSYWTRQHYLGHRPPISMKSQKSMQVFIKNVHGAIGYVSFENIVKGLHILYRWSDE